MSLLGKYVSAYRIGSKTSTQGLVIKEHANALELLHQNGDIVIGEKADVRIVKQFTFPETASWVQFECAKRGIVQK